MSSMLSAFKLKPFDLEPILEKWKDGPKFTGNPKKDPPVEEWLKTIKVGCIERGVPRECWHKVGRHFMGEKARARLDELKIVMSKVHGGYYRWNWQKFKIAMRNMGWNIDDKATEAVKVKSRPSLGLWWVSKEKEPEPSTLPTITESRKNTRPTPKRSESSFWLTRKLTLDKEDEKGDDVKEKENTQTRPTPSRSASSFWPIRKGSGEYVMVEEPESLPPASGRLPARKASSDTKVVTVREASKPPTPVRKDSNADDTVTTITNAPIWLLNACNALDFLQTEHPKVMSTISAILITAGSIPSIPAISAGAGGAILASGAIQTAGAIAVGIGSWMRTQQEAKAGPSEQPTDASKK